jgi:hypothetical protein
MRSIGGAVPVLLSGSCSGYQWARGSAAVVVVLHLLLVPRRSWLSRTCSWLGAFAVSRMRLLLQCSLCFTLSVLEVAQSALVGCAAHSHSRRLAPA